MGAGILRRGLPAMCLVVVAIGLDLAAETDGHPNPIFQARRRERQRTQGLEGDEAPADVRAGRRDEVATAHVKGMMRKAFAAYTKYAWGHDELDSVHGEGVDGVGFVEGFPHPSLGLSIIESLGTLHIMGLVSERDKALDWVRTEFTLARVRKLHLFEVKPFWVATYACTGRLHTPPPHTPPPPPHTYTHTHLHSHAQTHACTSARTFSHYQKQYTTCYVHTTLQLVTAQQC